MFKGKIGTTKCVKCGKVLGILLTEKGRIIEICSCGKPIPMSKTENNPKRKGLVKTIKDKLSKKAGRGK